MIPTKRGMTPIVHSICTHWFAHIMTLEDDTYGLLIEYKPYKKSRRRSKVIMRDFGSVDEVDKFAAVWVEQHRHEYAKQPAAPREG